MNAATDRIGDWMGMASGRVFWPLDPRANEVHIDDIAQALSNVCRFGGRSSEFYSVAQHSVWVARYVEQQWPGRPVLALQALLHDAAEAYLGDVVRPLKPAMVVERAGNYELFALTEERVMDAIRERFGLPAPDFIEKANIKLADDVALATEARDLMGDPRWPGLPAPAPERIEFLTPRAARTQFLLAFRRISEAVGALVS